MAGSRAGSCVRCGSRRWMRIAYGMPGADLWEAADRGEVELGGCSVGFDDPRWRCRVCRQLHGQPLDWTAVSGPRSGDFAQRHRPLSTVGIPDPNGSEQELREFALTFDGCAALDPDQLASIAGAAKEVFERSGRLPRNLAILRSCLFVEQRLAAADDQPFTSRYVRALVKAIEVRYVALVATDEGAHEA